MLHVYLYLFLYCCIFRRIIKADSDIDEDVCSKGTRASSSNNYDFTEFEEYCRE